MPKGFMNPSGDIYREIEVQPTDEKERLENHILAESFKMGNLDYDKIQYQSKKLESMK